MRRSVATAAGMKPMELLGRTATLAGPRGTLALRRSGPAVRAGEVLLALGLARLSRRAPVTYAVSRTALGLARRRMLLREAERRSLRRRRIRRSIVAATVLVAAAAGAGRALGGPKP